MLLALLLPSLVWGWLQYSLYDVQGDPQGQRALTAALTPGLWQAGARTTSGKALADCQRSGDQRAGPLHHRRSSSLPSPTGSGFQSLQSSTSLAGSSSGRQGPQARASGITRVQLAGRTQKRRIVPPHSASSSSRGALSGSAAGQRLGGTSRPRLTARAMPGAVPLGGSALAGGALWTTGTCRSSGSGKPPPGTTGTCRIRGSGRPQPDVSRSSSPSSNLRSGPCRSRSHGNSPGSSSRKDTTRGSSLLKSRT